LCTWRDENRKDSSGGFERGVGWVLENCIKLHYKQTALLLPRKHLLDLGPQSANILPNMPVHLLFPHLCAHFDALRGGVKRGLRGRYEILSIYIMGLTHMAQCVPHWRATGGPLWFRSCSEAKENTSIKLTQIFGIINCLLLVLLN